MFSQYHIRSFMQQIFICIIVLWTSISAIRTIYNISKLFTQERVWIGLAPMQRQITAYGDIAIIYQKLHTQLKTSDCMLLLSSTDTPYFLLRYLLYPQRIYSLNNGYSQQQTEQKNCRFLLLYEVKNEDAALSFSLATKKDIQLIDRFITNKPIKIGSYVYRIN